MVMNVDEQTPDQHSAEAIRLEIARRIYYALRAQYPDRSITLTDSCGYIVISHRDHSALEYKQEEDE
jgi:hypothetical protein